MAGLELLFPVKVRLCVLCDSFHSGLSAGLDLCTQTAAEALNEYLYNLECWVELAVLWAVLTSGGSLYIYIVFESLFIQTWGNYLSTVYLLLHCGLFHSILWLLFGGCSPTILLLTPRRKKIERLKTAETNVSFS